MKDMTDNFWDWLPKAYRDGNDGDEPKFTKYNMECAFAAGAEAKRIWVGLTNDEVNEFASGCHLGISVQDAIRKAEAKLKEKNT